MLIVRTFTFSAADTEASPSLAEGEAHVWVVALNGEASRWIETLAPPERSRASRYTSDLAGTRFIERRGVLRAILSKYTGLCPSAIAFRTNAYGRPELETRGEIAFSTSHSESVAIVAVARKALIGVDIEWLRADAANDGIAERFFAPNESASLASLSPSDRVPAFFSAWTRKEAIVKALGCGLSISLGAFEVSLRPDEPPAVLAWNVPEVKPRAWELRDLDSFPGYVAALAFTRS